MELKYWLILIGMLILIWLCICGIFSDNDYYGTYSPIGIEDYNVPPSNPYGN